MLLHDPAPLGTARPVRRRVVVDCRHFAVLLCAVLRDRGVPARPRCGFASYLGGDAPLEDHWACEYWDAASERWVTEDADLQRHDLPPDDFVTGARAWRLAAEDPAFADRVPGAGDGCAGPELPEIGVAPQASARPHDH